MSLLDEVDMKDVDTLLDDLFGGEASIQPQWNTTTDLGDDTTQPPTKRSRHEFDKSAPQMDDLLPIQTTSSSFIPNTDSTMFSLDQTFVTEPPALLATDLNTEVNSSQTTLQQISRELEGMQEQLKHIRNAQVNLPVPVQQSDFEQLDIDQKKMIAECYTFKEHLENIVATNILAPQYIFLVLSLDHELSVLLKKLTLYQEELHYYCSYNPQTSQPRCFCSLVILKQPFPKPIKHNTRAQNIETEEPVIVELISAPKASCRAETPVKAQLMHEDFHSKRGSVEIHNSEQPMDDEGFARFPDLRFPSGSRQKVVRLQFVVEVTYVQPNGVVGKQLLESDLTQPFIVMTNENQWKVSEGALLKKTAFDAKETISWPKFANLLQVHYLRATRQNPAEPKRPLSLRELQYISQLDQFKNKSAVHVRDFETFWNWFGDAMHKIRHQKHFSAMWLEGEIFGFIDKTEVARLIGSARRSGAFLVRFSERSSGSVAVAYSELDVVSGRIKLKHYLVKSKEFDDLAHFLQSHSNFQYLLPTSVEFSSRGGSCTRPLLLKREFTSKYLPQPKKGSDPGGYDPLTDPNDGPFFVTE